MSESRPKCSSSRLLKLVVLWIAPKFSLSFKNGLMCEKEFENTASFAFRVNNSIIGALSRLSSYLIVCSHFHLWFLMKIEIWETCHLLEVNPPQLARMYKTEAAVAVHCSNYHEFEKKKLRTILLNSNTVTQI